MKNIYSTDYLYRKYGARGSSQWENARRKLLAEYYGVPFSRYHAAGKVVFLPFLNWRHVQNETDQEKLVEFVEAYFAAVDAGKANAFGYVTFLSIHKVSKIKLPQIMKSAKTFADECRDICQLNIDRTGRPVTIRITDPEPDLEPWGVDWADYKHE